VFVKRPPALEIRAVDMAIAKQTDFNLYILTTLKKLVAKVYRLFLTSEMAYVYLKSINTNNTKYCTKHTVCAIVVARNILFCFLKPPVLCSNSFSFAL